MLEREYIGRSILPSHPDYPVLNNLAGMICLATNSHLFWNGFETVPDVIGQPVRIPAVDQLDREVLISYLKEGMWKELHGGRFADFINGPELHLGVDLPEE